jgi:NADPH-dependent glutamate synthase beta subunit-like oxidoreductase
MLRGMDAGEPPRLGRRVIVYGGGNTAMDAARTARRLGADEALVVYYRDRAHMSAHAFEADEALAEGVKIKWLSSIRNIDGSEITVEVMRLDERGRPQPTGAFETLHADGLILALGQRTDAAFLRKVPGIEFGPDDTVVVGADTMTGHPGVFAGGDIAPSERTVTAAVGHGKKAAWHIDAWLRGASYRQPVKHPVVTFPMLNLPFFADARRASQRELPVERRVRGFDEILSGLSREQATYEANRCLSCGNCFECDQCYAACPEQAIVKLGPGRRYRYEYERCTGCAVCYEQCPCHAIEMIPERGADALRGAGVPGRKAQP